MQFSVLNTKEDSKSFNSAVELKAPLTDSNINHLLSISRALLVVNYIAARQDYANLHVFFLGECRKETEALLDLIKDY